MLDLLILFVIAGFIFFRLFTVVGQRDEETMERALKRKSESFPLPTDTQPLPALEKKSLWGEDTPASVQAVITAVHDKHSRFTEEFFLAGAKIAFESIISAFAEGKKDVLKELIASDLFSAFEKDIDQREANNAFPQTTVVAIKEAKLVNGVSDKKGYYLDVLFISEQVTIYRNKAGKTIKGNASDIEDITETWTFMHEISSSNPSWKLVATRTE